MAVHARGTFLLKQAHCQLKTVAMRHTTLRPRECQCERDLNKQRHFLTVFGEILGL